MEGGGHPGPEMWAWLVEEAQNELLCYMEREREQEAETTVLQRPAVRYHCSTLYLTGRLAHKKRGYYPT